MQLKYSFIYHTSHSIELKPKQKQMKRINDTQKKYKMKFKNHNLGRGEATYKGRIRILAKLFLDYMVLVQNLLDKY